jgi:predicted nucleic-acid-binding protein
MKPRIYLDNCCFNRPYDDQADPKIQFETQAKLFIQGLVLSKEVELVWSYILTFENSRNIFEAKKNAISCWKNHSSQFVEASSYIVSVAEQITTTGIKPFDALHIACAIVGGCDYCITVDKRMLKYNDDRIVICNPIAFLNYYFKTV